jgi:hypothetical protein
VRFKKRVGILVMRNSILEKDFLPWLRKLGRSGCRNIIDREETGMLEDVFKRAKYK